MFMNKNLAKVASCSVVDGAHERLLAVHIRLSVILQFDRALHNCAQSKAAARNLHTLTH